MSGGELGEPSDRTAVTVEDTIKREYSRWMVPAPEQDLGGHGERDDAGACR